MGRLSFWIGCLGALLLGYPAVARADVIYDITLNSTQGNGQYSGTIAVNQAPPLMGTVIYQVAQPAVYDGATPGFLVTAFSILGLGPNNGTTGPVLTVSNDEPTLQFYDSGGFRSSGFYTLSIGATSFTYSTTKFNSNGFPIVFNDSGTATLTPEANAVTATTPEPGSLALLGTGLLALAALRRRPGGWATSRE